MEVMVVQNNDTSVFTINGEIDEEGAALISNHFQEIKSKTSVKNLVLDFKNVEYIGSSGIGVIILFYKTLALSGGKVTIKNASKKDL